MEMANPWFPCFGQGSHVDYPREYYHSESAVQISQTSFVEGTCAAGEDKRAQPVGGFPVSRHERRRRDVSMTRTHAGRRGVWNTCMKKCQKKNPGARTRTLFYTPVRAINVPVILTT
uniref:Uncharacterized protein n=1 Tax=Coccidioides posadasii RMSCC 3488 TaxID=454284 RepID=A0A0J6FQY3_COCPO|nr:hypothetical protein CPAG_09095 [Coccidioides posadasii RMSCC 3488]